MVVVVLGMHRSGSSLLSSILVDLGVHMGSKLLMRGRMQPHGHWEDIEFVNLNKRILAAAGGRWNRIPPHANILKVRGQFNEPIRNLVIRKNKRKKWGWKDPRTSLTIPLYYPHLVSPRYIRIIRSKSEIVQSLQRRHKGGHHWGVLCDEYVERVSAFLEGRPHLVVTYESLVNPTGRKRAIESINRFVNGNGRIKAAMERIKHD